MTDHLDRLAAELDSRLAIDDRDYAVRFPGHSGGRQPVHTVYVPADRVHAGLVAEWSERSISKLTHHAPHRSVLAGALDLDPDLVAYERVVEKLTHEPIEDLRIDFEDGYGTYPDEVEDDQVRSAAHALRTMLDAHTAPPYAGIRFKSFEAATRYRGLRTLDLFVRELGSVPDGFRVTLPKVTSVAQVEAMVYASESIENAYGLNDGALRFEIQVETPQAVLGPDGRALVAPMIHAARGRCVGLHYGTYDYSASLDIAAAEQSMDHPAADHAKAVMQVAAAQTGVAISDGSTNILPVGDTDAIRAAWRLHSRLVRRSLSRGIYQGWDLDPSQLPSRYAAVYAYFAADLPGALHRLRAYAGDDSSAYLDEPATAAALAGYVLRALDCGATSAEDVRRRCALDREQLEALARR
ncbi:HpcH/HpaI aldolase/citrate lyase family protein [Nocardioidaceae bacterium SCSIO 66511]|nr:HpcH/HpaI aldolase/citrate lyase family protein [Nocardioidaceae bacterium SCSIO 66511]